MGRFDGARVVVTGGAGFIGSALVRELVGEGALVRVLDNFATGKRANLEGIGERCQIEEIDIRNVAVEDRLRSTDIVFHLACLGVRHSIHSPVENHLVNSDGTLRLLEAARRQRVGRFVQVSSSEVYGPAQHAPMGEDHPTHPTTIYGASKLAGEAYARAYHRTYGLPAVVVRPFNVFGPRSHHEGDSGEVIPRFMLRAMAGLPMIIFGDGLQTRDFTFVDDTARAIAMAGVTPHVEGETINVGCGEEISIRNLADQVAAVTGRAADVNYDEARPGDVVRLIADATKARHLLGFQLTVGLGEGLRRLHAWYQSSGLDVNELLRQEITKNWTGSAARS
jgi:UDP-glucose 4-epimerase